MRHRFFGLSIFVFLSFSVFPFFSATAVAGQLVYSTYIGGSSDDHGSGIAMDNSGMHILRDGLILLIFRRHPVRLIPLLMALKIFLYSN